MLELRAQLTRHRARAAGPAADFLGEPRQFLGTQHQQRDAEDEKDFGEADFEHWNEIGRRRRRGAAAQPQTLDLVLVLEGVESKSASFCSGELS